MPILAAPKPNRISARLCCAFAVGIVGLMVGGVFAQTPPPATVPTAKVPADPKPTTPDFTVTESPSGTPTAAPIVVPAVAKVQIEKGLAMFAGIRDDAPFHWTLVGPRDEKLRAGDEMEERAYDEVFRHARQFSQTELESHARADLLLKDLFNNGRLSYKLDLITFDGQLRRLTRVEPTPILKESGITDTYEAWVFPKDQIEPVCVFFSELPTGLSLPTRADEQPNRWVTVTGYYFKLMQYESRKIDAVSGKSEIRRAPVLIGRSITLGSDPNENSVGWRETFMPVVALGIAFVGVTLIALTLYFRRGDRGVRLILDEKRQQNPFQ